MVFRKTIKKSVNSYFNVKLKYISQSTSTKLCCFNIILFQLQLGQIIPIALGKYFTSEEHNMKILEHYYSRDQKDHTSQNPAITFSRR